MYVWVWIFSSWKASLREALKKRSSCTISESYGSHMKNCLRISEDRFIQHQWAMRLLKELMWCQALFDVYPTERSLRSKTTVLVSTKTPFEEPFQFRPLVFGIHSCGDRIGTGPFRREMEMAPQKSPNTAHSLSWSDSLILFNLYLLGLEWGVPCKAVFQIGNSFCDVKNGQKKHQRFAPLPFLFHISTRFSFFSCKNKCCH